MLAAGPPQGERALRRATIALAAGVVLLAVATHARHLTGSAVLYATDAAQLQLPRFVMIDRALAERSLATWQTLLYGGAPFHANLENPSLYPPALLAVLALGPVAGMNAFCVLHLAFAALGAFLLVRRLIARLPGEWERVAPAGAAVAATCFALNHYMRSEALNLVIYGAAHAWVPWVLLAGDALVRGGSRAAAPHRARRAAGGLALALGLQLSTGGLYVIAYTWLALALWIALGAGPARYPRILAWGAVAALCFAGLAAAKVLPFLELLPGTNRAGGLSYAEARGVALGGEGDLSWIEAGRRALWYTGAGTTALLALCALPLARRSAALRATLVIALVGASVALGAETHRWLALVPPFDRIRGAIRAWTLVNAALPIAAGFGAAWLLARASALRASAPKAAAAGAAVCAALAPACLHSWRLEEALKRPQPLAELLGMYPHWTKVAELCGDERRGFLLEKHVPDGRNEQFVTTLLGVETPAGYLGHLWPLALERHLYLPDGREMAFERRARRLAVMSVGYVVAGVPPHPNRPEVPWFVEGLGVAAVPDARPRAILPSAAIGVIGDRPDDGWLYALLDAPSFPVARASLIAFADGTIEPEEAAALDAAIVVGEADAGALERLEQAGRLARVGGAPSADVAERALARVLGRPVPAQELGFERASTRASVVSLAGVPPRAGARFATVSEAWARYPGWRVEAGGRALAVRRADGVSSAVLVPPDARTVEASYRPRSVGIGIAAGALAFAVALFLLCAPPVRPRAREAEAEPEPEPEPEDGGAALEAARDAGSEPG